MSWNPPVPVVNLLTSFQPLMQINLFCIIYNIKELMKRRRRNPQAGKPPPRSLMREALLQQLELDLMPFRKYRSRRSEAWRSVSSSVSQESSAALSLDRYVKAFVGDKCTEKEDTSGTRRLRRNHTPPASEDFDTRRGLISSSPLHMNRIEEYSTSAFSTSGEHPVAEWTRHGYHHNHSQLSNFQILDQEGCWQYVQVKFDLSLGHSLVSEDTVRRLGIMLIPMPLDFSHSIYSTHLGLVEPRSCAAIQLRASPEMSPVSTNLASTKLLPGGWDMIVGKGLLDMLGGFTALPFMSMSPGYLNWTPPEPWIPIYSPMNNVTWALEDGAQCSRGYLNHPQCSIPQPDSDMRPPRPGLCGSTVELSGNLVQYQRREPDIL
ncbi:hypothetical protein NW759_001377 [Fusarium solani]|nr:hypothetical protein NW759_001377 [Fusarium solani]